jgi:hypothetical protein
MSAYMPFCFRAIRAALATCGLIMALNTYAARGIVLEKNTGQPIAGVFVFAFWQGQVLNPVEAKTVCYHAAITTTDAAGRFDLPENSGNLAPHIVERQRYVSAYMPGYREVTNAESRPNEIWMEKRQSDPSRFDAVFHQFLPVNCGMDPKSLLPVLKAQQAEAERLARTRDEIHEAGRLLYSIDEIEYGEKEALRRGNERERRFILNKGVTK